MTHHEAAFALECRDLGKTYRGGIVGLSDFSCDLNPGEFLLVAGPNGAGKTTLMRILSGEISPTQGSAKIMGRDVELDEYEVKAQNGVMPQEASVYDYLSAEEYLYHLARISGLPRPLAKERSRKTLDTLGLSKDCDRRMENLSSGQKRRVLLAQALVSEPPILLLDEPTAGLDPEGRQATWGLLKRLTRESGTSIVMTTHYLDEASELTNKILILNKGKKVFEGGVQELQQTLGFRHKVVVRASVAELPSLLQYRYTETEGRLTFWLTDNLELKEVLDRLMSERGVEFTIERPSLDESYLSMMGYERK